MNYVTLPRYPVVIDGETAEIGTAQELAIALDVLQGQHDRAVLEQLGPHLAQILAASGGLGLVLKSLTAEDQLFVIEAVGPALSDLMQSAAQLRDLLATMAHLDVEARLLEALGRTGLRQLIQTAEELAEVLEWVYGQCDRQALDLLGLDYVEHLVTSGAELGLVLRSLDEKLQLDVLQRLGWERTAQLVRSEEDLASLLGALSPEGTRQLLGSFSRSELAAFIGNQRDWEHLYNRLQSAEAGYLGQLLGVDPHAA